MIDVLNCMGILANAAMSQSRNDSERMAAATGNTMVYLLARSIKVPIADRLC